MKIFSQYNFFWLGMGRKPEGGGLLLHTLYPCMFLDLLSQKEIDYSPKETFFIATTSAFH